MNRKKIILVLMTALVSNSVYATTQPVVDIQNIVSNQEIPFSEEGIEEKIVDEIIQDIPSQKQREIVLTVNKISAIVDGVSHTLLAPPQIINGRTMLPLRFIVENILDAAVTWEPKTKQIRITKNEREVILTVGKRKALVDGQEVMLDVFPIIQNNITFVPVRFLSETFGLIVQYNHATKKINICLDKTQEKPETIIKPIAQFAFAESTYTEGQTVETIGTSYDAAGNAITERLWMIDNDPNKMTTNLKNLFQKPKAGAYDIALKVRNNKGIWSDWTHKEIVVNPNQRPVVTEIRTDKPSYAQGEEIKFEYTYENEAWEDIENERWTYRHKDESIAKAIITKPEALFTEGEYIITLELTDAYGNISDKYEKVIQITDEVKHTELAYRFIKGRIGEVIDNFGKFNFQSFKEIFPYETIPLNGTLIMSDSPELVKEKGILYQDSIEGEGKLLLHHINDFSEYENRAEKKRLVLIAQNTTNEPVEFYIHNKTIKGPSEDILYVGQQVLYEYLNGVRGTQYTLQPGEAIYLYDTADRTWGKGQCISGIMDIITQGKIVFTVASIGQNESLEEIVNSQNLVRDIHPRGTFDTIDIYYRIKLEEEKATKLLIGKDSSEWVNGYDALTGEVVQNRGNYGVTYHIKVTAKEDTGIILNPRGDIFRGAIKWQNDKAYLTPDRGYFSGENTKAVVLGTIKAGETKEFSYMLPNGSSAPVLVGFIPKTEWNNIY